MDLRDVVETLVELDDEQRAIINEVNRALDGLESAVVTSRRFGVGTEKNEATARQMFEEACEDDDRSLGCIGLGRWAPKVRTPLGLCGMLAVK